VNSIAQGIRNEGWQCEVDLYRPLLSFFRRYTLAFAEVPFFGKRIDLVFATPTIRRLYAIETKLRDWRNAFKQAALNQLVAQHSYVALPACLAYRLAANEQRLFASYDVGLIAVEESAKILIPATRNGYFNLRHYHTLKTTLGRAAKSNKPQSLGVLTNALTERSRTLVFLQTRPN